MYFNLFQGVTLCTMLWSLPFNQVSEYIKLHDPKYRFLKGYVLKLYNGLYFNLCILMCFRWWLYVLCYGLYHKYGPITKPTSFLIGLVFSYPWYKLHSCLVSTQQLLCLGNAMSGFVWCLRWRLFAFLLAFWRTSAQRSEGNFKLNSTFQVYVS